MSELHPIPSEERTAAQDKTTGLAAATLAAVGRRSRSGPAWLEARKAHAASWLESRGFPAPNDEAFRFTPLRPVLRTAYAVEPPTSQEFPSGLLELDAPRIVLVNGALVDADGSDGNAATSLAGAASGLQIRRLSQVLSTEPERVDRFIGAVASVEHGFDATNLALLEDALVVFVRRGARAKLHLVHLAAANAAPALSVPRVLVVGEPESELSLLETHQSTGGAQHLECSVTELVLGAGASIEHVRAHHGSATAASLATVAVRQEQDSRYASKVFTFGGSLSRLDLRVLFAGRGAECSLDGLYLAGAGALVDHHTTVDHESPRCTSRERYKGILDGDGIAVFDGTVFVRRGANATAAHQENRNLLLSGDAVVHTKPHLEIDTDDVKCSHGATVGRLDPAQLFYLRARGMDEPLARALLTYAFAREMAQSVPDRTLREELEKSIGGFLPGGGEARELA
jgi:Fe-S cluster assembly protein SufD